MKSNNTPTSPFNNNGRSNDESEVPLLTNNDDNNINNNGQKENYFESKPWLGNFKITDNLKNLQVQNLPEAMKQSFNSASLRDLNDFFGIGESSPFTLPTWPALIPRIQSNINYYWMNYFGLILSFTALSILVSPSSLIALISLIGGWYLAFHFYRLNRTVDLRISNDLVIVLNRNHFIGFIGLVSLWPLIVIFSESIGSWIFFVGIELSLIHAGFRGSAADGSGGGVVRAPMQFVDAESGTTKMVQDGNNPVYN